jgi:hypothetical protein
MSWHTNAILIKADFSADYRGLLEKLGLHGAEAGAMVSLDDAASASSEGVAAGTTGGWTALWGNLALYMIDQDGLAGIAQQADVFQMTLEGASGTAGFTWWIGGKVVRDWMRQAGEVIKKVGKRLPQEKEAFADSDDEQAVLEMLVRLTLPWEELEAISYRMYEFSEDALFGE